MVADCSVPSRREPRSEDDHDLYEFERGDDFVSARLPYIDVESVSPFTDRADLKEAVTYVSGGYTQASRVIDMGQFIKYFAMEFLLKHFDGFTHNLNNTYFCNDRPAVATPKGDQNQIKFRPIPWGLDSILQPEEDSTDRPPHYHLTGNSTLGALVRNDVLKFLELLAQIRTYSDTVLGRSMQAGEIKQFIDLMQNSSRRWVSTRPPRSQRCEKSFDTILPNPRALGAGVK